jgi:hypothetical protein
MGVFLVSSFLLSSFQLSKPVRLRKEKRNHYNNNNAKTNQIQKSSKNQRQLLY